MHSAKESFEEARVPDGRPYYSLRANMQEVTVVYLNRFVKEFLSYLSVLFHFCPAPAQASTPARKTPAADSTTPSALLQPERPTSAALDTEKFAQMLEELGVPVLLDVEMQAPVIVMPRHSTSDDSLEVDLGVLQLTSSISIMSNMTQVVDLMDVQLQQVCRSDGHLHILSWKVPHTLQGCLHYSDIVETGLMKLTCKL
jgi:hypothetical protein